MRKSSLFLALGLSSLLGFVGCGESDSSDGDATAGRGGAGGSAGSSSAGSNAKGGSGGIGGSNRAGTGNEAGAGDEVGGAGNDGGGGDSAQAGGGAGETGETGGAGAGGDLPGGGGAGGSADDACSPPLGADYFMGDDGYVNSSIKAAITKQLSPLDLNEPAIVELGTLSYYPVELSAADITVPSGWQVSSIEEDWVNRKCPSLEQGRLRCRQYFVVKMYSIDACQFDGDYQLNYDVSSANGDCNLVDPSLTSYAVNAKLSSENFCEGQTLDFAPYRPTAEVLSKGSAGTITLQVATTINHPYTLEADTILMPPGFTLDAFAEDEAQRVCDDGPVADGCRQVWNVKLTPGPACFGSGSLEVLWNVGCDQNGNCDPGITSFALTSGLTDKRQKCL